MCAGGRGRRSMISDSVHGGQQADFFVSYTRADLVWASWITATLERAGYAVRMQDLDFFPGSDFLHEMQRAILSTKRTIVVLSEAYLASAYAEAEWRAAYQRDPSGERGLLIPVRVDEVSPPGLLSTRVFIDIAHLDEEEAARALLDGVLPCDVRSSTRRASGHKVPF